MMHEIIDTALAKLTEKEIKNLTYFLESGRSLGRLAGVTSEEMDLLYCYAVELFDTKKYKEAKSIFEFLSRLRHWSFDYWFSLGLCCQQLNEYDKAILYFERAGLLQLDDPRAPYSAALCHQACGKFDLANKAINAAIKNCSDNLDYISLKEILLKLESNYYE